MLKAIDSVMRVIHFILISLNFVLGYGGVQNKSYLGLPMSKKTLILHNDSVLLPVSSRFHIFFGFHC